MTCAGGSSTLTSCVLFFEPGLIRTILSVFAGTGLGSGVNASDDTEVVKLVTRV